MSFDSTILANERSLVMEFGRGEEWLIFVGGISDILGVRAGMCKNPHEAGRTGAFATVTSSPRRNVQKSTRVINEDLEVGHLARMNVQKSTWGGHAGRIRTQIVRRAGRCKKSHAT